MTGIAEHSGYRVAPTWMRMVAGLADFAIVAALSMAAAFAWFRIHPADLPPRYWNYLDYSIDLFYSRPDLVVPPAVILASLYLVWEVAWGVLSGNAPVASFMGMKVRVVDGNRPGVARVALRAAVSAIGFVAGFAGPLLAFVQPQRRMLHDIISGCVVLAGSVPRDEGNAGRNPRVGMKGPDSGTYSDGPRR